MPNWVRHSLTIIGPEGELSRFMQECFTETSEGRLCLDFDKIIAQPEHIRESVTRNDEMVSRLRTLAGEGRGDRLEPLKVVALSGCDRREPDWYQWRWANWGTKWNADCTEIVRETGKLKLWFETAWAPPEPIFSEIAHRFPALNVWGSFSEEMFNFEGNIRIENGRVEYEDKSEQIQAEFEQVTAKASDVNAFKPV